MNWFLFGAASGAAMATNPDAGDRMMSGLIYGVCYLLPLMPLLFAAAEKKGYKAVKAQLWAKLSMAGAALFGYAGLIYVGLTVSIVELSDPALLVALVSLVWGLFTLLKAKKMYRPKYDLEELVRRITPENKHDFSDTDFGCPVGREKL